MKNYYYILGVEKNATQEQIKLAFRKLSKKYHPDVNDGDKFFEERFKELREAYETLSNSEKRYQYENEFEDYFSNSSNQEELKQQQEFYQNIFASFEERERTLLENSFFELAKDLKYLFLNPRKVFRVVFNRNYTYTNIHLLALILSVLYIFRDSLEVNEEEKVSEFIVDFTYGLVFFILGIHIITAAIYFTQKLYKGIATYKELFSVNVISLVPTGVSFFLLVILRAITGNEDYDTYQLFITLPLGIYTFVFDIVGISEAQQVSKRIAFFNLAIAGILIFIPFMIVMAIFYSPS